MATITKITAHLWFAHEAEAAAVFYTKVFKHSSLGQVSRYTQAGQEIHKMKPGSVMTVEFELEGTKFIALNGGPLFKFNESISFMVNCDNQDEIDYYWEQLGEGGDPEARQCGWLKDKFGVSWQVVPTKLRELIHSDDEKKTEKVMAAMMKMKKMNIADLEAAAV